MFFSAFSAGFESRFRERTERIESGEFLNGCVSEYISKHTANVISDAVLNTSVFNDVIGQIPNHH
jgi:hypothetical protein